MTGGQRPPLRWAGSLWLSLLTSLLVVATMTWPARAEELSYAQRAAAREAATLATMKRDPDYERLKRIHDSEQGILKSYSAYRSELASCIKAPGSVWMGRGLPRPYVITQKCDHASLKRTFDTYEQRRRWLCAQIRPVRKEPSTDVPDHLQSRVDRDAAQRLAYLRRDEYQLARECRWDRSWPQEPRDKEATDKGAAKLAQGHLVQLARIEPIRRAHPLEPELWRGHFQGVQIGRRKLCDRIAFHGLPSGPAPIGIRDWGAYCAPGYLQVDLAAFSGSAQLAESSVPPSAEEAKKDLAPPAELSSGPTVLRVELTPMGGDQEATVIPVPGELSLKVTGSTGGNPARLARVGIEIITPNAKFVQIDTPGKTSFNRLDAAGQYGATLRVQVPAYAKHYMQLSEVPLHLALRITLKDADEDLLAEKRLELPFNLARIHGVTVGPDGEERKEAHAPTPPYRGQRVAQEADDSGGFHVLLHPIHPKVLSGKSVQRPVNSWRLVWPEGARLELELPISEPKPGQEFDLGPVDLLSPEEHVQRLKDIVERMILQLGLARGEISTLVRELRNLPVNYGKTDGEMLYIAPFRGAGSLGFPENPQKHWGSLPERNIYALALHEFGHFVHLRVVEHHRDLLHYRALGLDHSTWSVKGDTILFQDTRRQYTAFAEASADLFARLALASWKNEDPVTEYSPYFKWGYLAEFDSDYHARKALAKDPRAHLIEGVQTRFWCALYRRLIDDEPEYVLSDVLAVMQSHASLTSTWFRGHPARTINEWIWARATGGSPRALGLKHGPYVVGARYQLGTTPGMPTVGAWSAEATTISLDGKSIDLQKEPIVPLEKGALISVLSGEALMDVPSSQGHGSLRLPTGAEIVLQGPSLVAVLQGKVRAAGEISLVTPAGLAQPKGTAYAVEVAPSGATRVAVYEGHVQVEGKQGQARELEAGQEVRIRPGQVPGEISHFDLEAAAKLLGVNREDRTPFEISPPTDHRTILGVLLTLGGALLLILSGVLAAFHPRRSAQ